VNIASRLEGRTKHYGVGILAGEVTRNAVKDVLFREVDRIRVKGKGTPVTIYEPIGLQSEVGSTQQEELRLWHQTLRVYRAQQWDQADVNLLNLQRMAPERGLYRKFSEKVAELRRSPPPPDWDGVKTFDEK
jgi:adenylate cyclase